MSEDYEPSEKELDEAHTAVIVRGTSGVRIEGLTVAAVETIVRETIRARYDLEETARKAVADQVAHAVEAIVAKTGKEQIAEAVASVLAEGWVEHDRWGETTGERMTLKQRLNEILTEKTSGDRYRDDPGGTLIDRTIRTTIKERLDKEFGEVLKEAKLRFQVEVDAILRAKLADTLKKALGL